MVASPDTDELLNRTAHGDRAARDQLLVRHQQRLRKVVAWRLDRRLTARVDPSDVVQEVLAEASRRLPDYLRDRPLPFYPWLRQMALERLVELHRRHVQAQRRSVRREEAGLLALPDESIEELAGRLVASTSSPSDHVMQQEVRERVRAALKQLRPADREVLELRHLEQLSVAETAAVLGISTAAAKTRHLRALQRLRELLEGPSGEDRS
jgi:RNA polymerase sigma-70 factor (ECF subfamily)